MNIKDFVGKDILGQPNKVFFNRYKKGFFYYRVTNNKQSEFFEFSVPIEDIGDATLLETDKAITYMRYIRKAIEENTLVKC